MKESSKTPAKNPAQKPAPRLSRVIDTLKKKGASEVRVIKAADVIVDERVRLKCQVPICDSYGKNLMCPPYLPSCMFTSVFPNAFQLGKDSFMV